MAQKPTYLTKTRYVSGLACRKWLWLAFNAPERLPEADASARFLMEEGRQIGELARLRYAGGVLLPVESPRGNDQRSRKLLERGLPLFEAGFIHPDGACYSRADVLLPAGKDGWDLVEVKSGGNPKPEHLLDVAFQRYCYAGAGLKVRKCSLLLIDTTYERSGEVDPVHLFQELDVTAAVDEITPTVEPKVGDLLKVAKASECPEFGRGEPFHKDEAGVHEDDSIWKDHPGSDVLDLYRGGKQALQLMESGVFRIGDIPKNVVLRGRQVIQHSAHTSGQVHVDREKIAGFLGQLKYPLHYLDFETFSTAIPVFDGVRPYQKIPFQYSLHVVDEEGGKTRQYSFLSMEPEDPREGLVSALRSAIGSEGSIVVYNQSFEKGVLAALGTLLPGFAKWVKEVNPRIVDLLVPFREFAYYNPAQGGSASLKAVLPALTGRSYEGFEIANGSAASLAYLGAVFGTLDGEKASPGEVEQTRKALERYCGQDTEGMVWIVEELTALSQIAAQR